MYFLGSRYCGWRRDNSLKSLRKCVIHKSISTIRACDVGSFKTKHERMVSYKDIFIVIMDIYNYLVVLLRNAGLVS
jgi:hypothetical protein